MRTQFSKLAFLAALALALTFAFSCSSSGDDSGGGGSNIPPEIASSSSFGESSSSAKVAYSSSFDNSSSSVEIVSSSSFEQNSSSSVIVSSSSVLTYTYCVFPIQEICLPGPMTSCPSGGILSDICPYESSSSSAQSPSSSSSSSVTIGSSSSGGFAGTSGSFKDDRDNNSYKWVKIGEQYWMAENLNYNALGSKCGNDSSLTDANTASCDTFGRLYNWATAMANSSSSTANPSGVRGVCPSGWHLPSRAEWDTLITFVGGTSTAGRYLKAMSGWSDSGNGQDTYGFSALPGGNGNYTYGSFNYVGENGYWWGSSASEYASYSSANKGWLFSVRCVQD